jgi:uncharacterized membrane protein YoaT (DUF817 family)
MEQLPDAGAGEAKSEQKPKRRSRKKLWVIIVLALVSAIAWVVIYLTRAQQSYYDGHAVPVYGVFLTTPLYSAYAIAGYNSSIMKLLRKITAQVASFTLTTISFVVGLCIYAARKVTRG